MLYWYQNGSKQLIAKTYASLLHLWQIMEKKKQRVLWPSDSEFDDISISRCAFVCDA